MFKTLTFKDLFFGTHSLLDRSLKVLELPTHLSKLASDRLQCNP